MTVTIVETRAPARAITGGVDTHAGAHVAAALDPVGGLLGVQEFPATPAGYAQLLGWLGGFAAVCLVGIEGTGSYGAGLAGISPRRACEWWRSTGRTGRTGGGRASLTRWMRSAPPGLRSPAGQLAHPRAATAPSRRSAR